MQVLMNPSFMESIRKRSHSFIQQALDRDGSNMYRKSSWPREEIAIILTLHIEAAMLSSIFEKYQLANVQEKIIVADLYCHFHENMNKNCISKSFGHL